MNATNLPIKVETPKLVLEWATPIYRELQIYYFLEGDDETCRLSKVDDYELAEMLGFQCPGTAPDENQVMDFVREQPQYVANQWLRMEETKMLRANVKTAVELAKRRKSA